MSERFILGIAGAKGAGKTTAANAAIRHLGFGRVKFADTLKNMLRTLGLGEREIEGDLKEVPCELLGGRTPRHAMQTLGTEWGREMITPDLWLRTWSHACDQIPADRSIVVDDVRFANEADFIKRYTRRSLIIRIMAPGIAKADNHVSEDQSFPVDATIVNNGTIADLWRKLILELEPVHRRAAP